MLKDSVILGRERKANEIASHPSVGIENPGLTALSWLPFLNNSSGILQKRPEFVLDRYPAWDDDGFVKDNFGTLYGSLRSFPSPTEISDNLQVLLLTPRDAPINRWRYGIANAEELSDGYALAERLIPSGKTVTLAHLSNLHCQRHSLNHDWKYGFCVVVGDTFEDRVSCWNAALLFDDAQIQVYKTLRVPAATILDEEKTKRIGNFLRHSNWIGQNSGPARIVVRSFSLSATEVQPFTDALRKLAGSVDFKAIESLDECCPFDAEKIEKIGIGGGQDDAGGGAPIRDSTVVVSVPVPKHLSYCAGLHPMYSAGSWFIDLVIDRLQDNGRFDNVRETWRLPARPQLLRLFHDGVDSRLLRNGEIAIKVDVSKRVVEVMQPEDKEIFFSVLNEQPRYSRLDMRSKVERPVAYKYSAPSDKGRYLQGLLGMFGTLNGVEQVLGSHFWRSQFLGMAAPAQGQQEEVIKILQRRMKAKNGNLEISDESGWASLAERVIQLSSSLRVPRGKVRFDQLLDTWRQELNSALDKKIELHGRREEFLAEAPGDLKRSLEFLLECGVFYRGHDWVCWHCSHRNWVGIDSLANTLPCEVCRKTHQLPVDVSLEFRINEFFATCLREHDTLTVAWALCALRQESRASFIFAPQTDLFREYPEIQKGKRDRELDVVCIVDGKLVIGEAKAQVSKIKRSDIEDLAEVAKELNADVAILMAMSGSAQKMNEKVVQLRELLPKEIEVRGLVSDWDEELSIAI